MHTLVAGGSGFIGSHVCDALHARVGRDLRNPSDVRATNLDIRKARSAFDGQPRVDLATGIGRHWSWLQGD